MSSPKIKNISLVNSENQHYNRRRLIPEKGRWPSPPNVGMGCGGRFCSADDRTRAYGEVVWSWRRDAGAKLAGSVPPMTVTTSPLHRGEHEVRRKTIAQGMSACSPLTCMLVCAFVCATGTRDRGCSAHPAFPAPSVLKRGDEIERLGRNHAARTDTYVSTSLRAKRSNPSLRLLRHGLLRRKRSSQ